MDDATLYYPTHTEEWSWSAIRLPYPDDVIVVREVNRPRASGRSEYRSIVLPNEPIDPFAAIQPPWWFVGAQMDDDNTIAITDMLADFLVVGNRITPTLLERLNHDIPKNRLTRWFYIDPETFEEKEFPSDGIVVKAYANTPEHTPEELPHED